MEAPSPAPHAGPESAKVRIPDPIRDPREPAPVVLAPDGTPLVWRHVILNLRRTWLPGDARGFRSRGRRVRSSGDYRNPPPPEEHAGLRDFNLARCGPPAPPLTRDERRAVAAALLAKLADTGTATAALAVAAEHVHVLALLPRSRPLAVALVGRAKQFASHRLRDARPGRLWADNGSYHPVRDRGHWLNAAAYVALRQEPGSVVWTTKAGWYVLLDRRGGRRRLPAPEGWPHAGPESAKVRV